MCDQYNPLEFRSFGRYYSYDNELFANEFPENWVLDMNQDNTGPKNCANCAGFGCWRGVFLGYCAHCSKDIYHGKRGAGFIYNGIEESAANSIFGEEGYMKGVTLADIGDIEFNEKDTLDDDGNPYVPYDLVLENGIYRYDRARFRELVERGELPERRDDVGPGERTEEYEGTEGEGTEGEGTEGEGTEGEGTEGEGTEGEGTEEYEGEGTEGEGEGIEHICPGCRDNQPNQLAHCGINGCIHDYNN